MKPVLVTGACGFSGSHMVKILKDEGIPVRGTDLSSAFDSYKAKFVAESIGLDWNSSGLEFVPSDLRDKESLAKVLEGVGTVYHTGGLVGYYEPPQALEKVNVEGTKNLCEAVLEQGAGRLIHWSSACVYGRPFPPRRSINPLLPLVDLIWGYVARPWSPEKQFVSPGRYPINQPFTEQSSNPLNTQGDGPVGTYLMNDYSRSKWRQEQVIQSYGREHGLPYTILRLAPLYGPGSDYQMNGVIISVAEGLLSYLPLDLRNYLSISCHVRDIGRAALFVSQREDTVGEVYNVVDSSITSQLDFMMTVALLVGRKVHLIPLIRMPWVVPVGVLSARYAVWLEKKFEGYKRIETLEEPGIRFLCCSFTVSNRKLKDLGFAFEYPDVRQGIKDTVEWLIGVGWIK